MDQQLKGPVAIINVFTVQPEHQQELMNIITTYSQEVASTKPGFISARFHAALDKTRVTSVIYWETQMACQTFIQSPETRPFLEQCEPLIQGTDSHFYMVVADVLAHDTAQLG